MFQVRFIGWISLNQYCTHSTTNTPGRMRPDGGSVVWKSILYSATGRMPLLWPSGDEEHFEREREREGERERETESEGGSSQWQ